MILNPTFGKGATFTPSVSQNGDLSWTNDGGLPNPAPVNIRGPAGPSFTTAEKVVLSFMEWEGVAKKTLISPAKMVVIIADEMGFVIPASSWIAKKTGNQFNRASLSADGSVLTVTRTENNSAVSVYAMAFS